MLNWQLLCRIELLSTLRDVEQSWRIHTEGNAPNDVLVTEPELRYSSDREGDTTAVYLNVPGFESRPGVGILWGILWRTAVTITALRDGILN